MSLLDELLPADVPRGIRLHSEAMACFQQGDFEGALSRFRQARTEFRRVGYRHGEGVVLAAQSSCLLHLKRLSEALETARQALEIAHRTGDSETEQTTLHEMGEIHLLDDQPEAALDAYRRALDLARERGDREEEADELTSIAGCLSQLGRHLEALEHLKKAVPLYEKLECRVKLRTAMAGLFMSLSALGKAGEEMLPSLSLAPESEGTDPEHAGLYHQADLLTRAYALFEAEDPGRALVLTEELLALVRQKGDLGKVASTLHLKGNILYDLERYEEARDCNEEALALRRRHGLPGESASLYRLGLDHEALGQLEEASRYTFEALELFGQEGNEEGVDSASEALLDLAHQLNNRGVQGYKDRRLDEARASLEKACAMLRRVPGAESRLSQTLKSLGDVHKGLGRFEEAHQSLEEALEIRRRLGEEAAEAEALDHIGSLHQDVGNAQQALACYEKALEKHRRTGDLAGEAVSLGNIALIYLFLGEPQRALRTFLEVLEIDRSQGNRKSEAITLNNIGGAYNQLNERREARSYFEQALAIHREMGNREQQVFSLLNLANGTFLRAMHSASSIDSGEIADALDLELEAVRLAEELGNPFLLGHAYMCLGGSYETAGFFEEGKAHLEKALAFWRQIGHREHEAWTLGELAMADAALGRTAEARGLLESSLKLLEEHRATYLTPDFRAGSFLRIQDLYAYQLSLLLQEQDLHQAFEAMERTRARSFLDLLDEARAEIRTGGDPHLERREGLLLRQLAEVRAKLTGWVQVTPEEGSNLERNETELERAFQACQAEIRRTDPRYAAMRQTEPWGLERVQRDLLDTRTILLEYALGSSRSVLMALLPDRCEAFELPPRAEIETRVTELRDAVLAGSPYPHGHELYRLLVAPAAELLGERNLLVVADGALHYLPFGLLLTDDVDPRRTPAEELPYLIRQRSVTYAPSATIAGELKCALPETSPSWPRVLVAFADPRPSVRREEASPSRLLERLDLAGALADLPGTRREVVRIASIVEGGDRGFSAMASGRDDEFRSERVELYAGSRLTKDVVQARFDAAGRGGAARFVHFATHGLLDETASQFSGLVLSSETTGADLWQTFEIRNCRIPSELVVLSACKTGLGRMLTGEGLVGLARAFFYAGASSVCATLWSIADEASADLMCAFYRHLLGDPATQRPPLSRAEALRQAQLELIGSRAAAHPYFWAGYVLLGPPG